MRIILLFSLAGLAGAILAGKKGRNPLGWFFLCALAPLVIAVLAMLPALPVTGYTKKCSYCSEIIKADAKRCRYCHEAQPLEMTRE